MFATAEVRWFGAGTIPEEIEGWYRMQAAPGSMRREEREDWYLRIPGCSHVGVKLRGDTGGNAELKIRDAVHENERFSDRVSGAVELWRKTTVIEPRFGEGDGPAGTPNNLWVLTRKNHSWYTIQRDGARVAIELTIITLHDDLWWTIGFESSGDDERRVPALTEVAGRLLSTVPTRLPLDASYGYPQWLAANG